MDHNNATTIVGVYPLATSTENMVRKQFLMAGWKDVLLDVLKLTDEVKRLNGAAEKLSERTIDMDKRLVRLETMVEVAQKSRLPGTSGSR